MTSLTPSAKPRRPQETALHSATLRRIHNPDALALWAYLMACGGAGEANMDSLRKRFGLGRERSAAAVRELKVLGLMSQSPRYTETRRLCGSALHVHARPIKSKTSAAGATGGQRA